MHGAAIASVDTKTVFHFVSSIVVFEDNLAMEHGSRVSMEV